MAKVEIKVEHRVGCTITFFLVKESKGQHLPMVLLRQPFTRAMKMTFEHGEHRSIDVVLYDPNSNSTYIVSVVPLVKKSLRNVPYTQVKDAGSEGEN